MFEFTPQEEDEREWPLLADGDYDFEIIEVDCNSLTKRSQRPQIALVFEVKFDNNIHKIYAYIQDLPQCAFMVRGLCNTIGHPEYYKGGKISDNMLLGEKGKFHIITDEFDGKKRNKVRYYIYPKRSQKTTEAPMPHTGPINPVPDKDAPPDLPF